MVLKQVKSEKTVLGASNMQISEKGISLIKHFEGCRLEAYQDSVGIWTIGYGTIKGVKEGDKINQDEAEHLLQEEMVFNLGPNNLKSSTLLKVLNEGEYDEVPEQVVRWNKAGGKVLEGLKKRREAESLLFQGKEWENV